MIKDLQTAIINRYNSVTGATLRALIQGIYEDEAPSNVILATQTGTELQNSVKPFITFTLVTTGLQQDTCSNMFEPLVQFTIYGDANNKSSLSLLSVHDEFLNLFGDTILTMSNGYTMVRSDIVGQNKFKDENKMWNIVTEIQYIVQKDR